MKQIRVQLKENSYDIIIFSGALKNLADLLQTNAKKIFIITDDNVAKLYLTEVEDNLKASNFEVCSLILPHGEKTKSFESLPKIYDKLLSFGITRNDLIITLGGGVVGDLGGFVASTYLRGIDYIQVPTTLLAQVDSSIGGKVAVDLAQGKNLVGSFWQPKRVIIDIDVLNTLSDYYFSDGMAEVIKYGCIKDSELFDMILYCGGRKQIMNNIEAIVSKCCEIKAKIVEEDERDFGDRMLLNFGHTYGHALEKFYNFEKLSHGQAVAIGMYFITCISEKKCQTVQGVSDKLKEILQMYNLPIADDAKTSEVVKAVANDKKNFGSVLKIVVLSHIGNAYLYPTTAEYFS